MRKTEFRDAVKIAGCVTAITFGSIHLAHAQSGRPDTRTMTCGQVQSMLERNDAAILRTGPNTFDRYVSNRKNSCAMNQFPWRDFIPTKDNKKCFVHRCVENGFRLFSR